MNAKWTQENIPDLAGKVVVITGANSGLGFACARILAARGATVVMTARNITKGNKAQADILQNQPNASLDLMQLDVGDLRSVHAFAAAFKAKFGRLDVLLNNAGIMAIPRQETVDGFEMQFGVNHLGHFALTGLLIDIIVKTPHARIHNVTSSANYTGTMNFDDLMGEKEYSRWAAYGQSKLANILFTLELQERLTAAGYDTIVNTSHPGMVMGNLQTNSVAQSNTRMEAWLYRLTEPLFAQDIKMGVLPMLYGMTAEDARGGVFYGPRWLNVRGYPAEKKANKEAYDAATRQRLWQVSERLTGVHYG
ncbi:MAG: SDR family oxidoreductase [Anaerolineales bacterium]|nr:SDR family oxidoreductase [Anaerolineales bacterium]MCB8950566.1 SDR family oxidoreductase [Ardenticatenales bacterium]